MWITLEEQTVWFLWSIALGAAAALLYDLIRAVRIFLKAGRLHLLIGDVLFFVLCGIITSLFALPFNKGNVRAFILFGEAAGFLCWRLTIGTVAGRFYSILSKAVRQILKKICELLKKFFDLLLKIASRVVYNVSVVIELIKHIVSAGIKRIKRRRRTVRKNSPPQVRKAEKHRRTGHEERNRNQYEREYRKKRKGFKTRRKTVSARR